MQRNPGQVMIGCLLLFMGGFFLLSNFGMLRGEAFLIFLGLAFVGAYFFSGRQVGLLIPGAVLTAVGSFAWFESMRLWRVRPSGGWFFVFLGLAFAMVFIVDSLGRPKPSTWALFPSAGLLLFGFFVLAVDVVPRTWWHMATTWWPVLLILLGALIMLKPRE